MEPGFENAEVARALSESMATKARVVGKPVKVMEVCGTHTMEIARHGLRAFLPQGTELVSGPGCPVCVTPDAYVDAACSLALDHGAVVATFGDMIRVPGCHGSLEDARARGGDVRVVYSPVDALAGAQENPDQPWVFLGVGFETTTPAVASTVLAAAEAGVENFTVLAAPKTVPAALQALLDDEAVAIDGFLCPGHVSVIIGPEAYEPVAARGVPCVVAGFTPLDVLASLGMLLAQLAEARPAVEVQYFRAVKSGGNARAREVVDRVFAPCDARWRGLGVIPGSGLAIRDAYAVHDAEVRFKVSVDGPDAERGCRCGDVLKGVLSPRECPLFANRCRPENPVGPCMVSSEGSCAAAYKYGRTE